MIIKKVGFLRRVIGFSDNRIVTKLAFEGYLAIGVVLNLNIDCRTVTNKYKWIDDMHPGSKGFKALAKEFAKVIG